MGSVYQAWDWNLNETVALKVLRLDKSSQSDRFARETELLSKLDHPGVVRCLGHGHLPDGRPYLAMEWLEGETLAERLRRELLTVGEGLGLMALIADALAVAHQRGIVHRDLKPGNIFLVSHALDQVKLLDFGIASARGEHRELTETNATLGTPGYMAPEQIQSSKGASATADIFSLGCVLFRCLTGRIPYWGRNTSHLVVRMMTQPPASIGELRPDAVRAVDELVSRMLDRDPKRRPADGTAAAMLLRELVAEHDRSGFASFRPPLPKQPGDAPTAATQEASGAEPDDW